MCHASDFRERRLSRRIIGLLLLYNSIVGLPVFVLVIDMMEILTNDELQITFRRPVLLKQNTNNATRQKQRLPTNQPLPQVV